MPGVARPATGLWGALVAATSAYRAGLRSGDVISRVNGKPVFDDDDLIQLVGALEPGEAVEFQVVRDGRTRTFTLTPERAEGMTGLTLFGETKSTTKLTRLQRVRPLFG